MFGAMCYSSDEIECHYNKIMNREISPEVLFIKNKRDVIHITKLFKFVKTLTTTNLC